jgi:glycosyltransferase involved in cell wall biosynthesis
MTPLAILTLITAVAAALATLWWTVLMGRLVRIVASGMSLRRGLVDPVEESLLSIVVPAHNEERVIATCIDSLLAQRWTDIEVIVVADRCTDATESIVRERAATDPRLILISNRECPQSWAGKCHAARLGAAHTTGEWLVFVDADTKAHPDLMTAAVTEASRRETALLSLLSDLTSHHWFERSTQPVAMMALLSLFPPDAVNRDDRPRTFANGQFMLFDRGWYDRIGGHATVKNDLLEDIAFAGHISRAGGRVNILRSDGLLSCSMYGSHEDFLRGWMRIFLEATKRQCRVLRKQAFRQILFGIILPLLCLLAVVLGSLVAGPLGWITLVLGLAGLLTQAAALLAVYRIARQPLWTTLLYPLGAWEVAKVMRWADRTLRKREPVKWGGREYVMERRD